MTCHRVREYITGDVHMREVAFSCGQSHAKVQSRHLMLLYTNPPWCLPMDPSCCRNISLFCVEIAVLHNKVGLRLERHNWSYKCYGSRFFTLLMHVRLFTYVQVCWCITWVTHKSHALSQKCNFDKIEGQRCIWIWLVLLWLKNDFTHLKIFLNSTFFHV